MNKAQEKQLDNVRMYIRMEMDDCAARALSAMIRAALVRKTAQQLQRFAFENGLHVHPEFRI